MTLAKRENFRQAATVAAMQAIVANPVAWAELKTEAKANQMSVVDGVACAACNLAESLTAEFERREIKSNKPPRRAS